ncbi:MAG: response regulator [Planctomycetes bacterium]|nr:response regulator [Planctomycetota bacterium]
MPTTPSPPPDARGPMTGPMPAPEVRLLVVDDDEKNRLLLRDLLEAQRYQVVEAADGHRALRLAREARPHSILLDVMMPDLDGFEVCRRIKADPVTAAVPVLLVTALTDRAERLAGIEAGANDFLSKPIDTQDVLLRVRNAVHAKCLFDQVQAQVEQLQRLEALRDDLTHMIVHDMRSPLTTIRGCLELFRHRAGPRLEGKETPLLDRAYQATGILLEMASSVLDVSRLEAGQMPLDRSRYDLATLVTEFLAALGSFPNQCRIAFQPPPCPMTALCDAFVIRRVLFNLVGNAIKFTPAAGEVRIRLESRDDQVQVSVSDTGRGIPEEYHQKIFEKFGQVAAGRGKQPYSTGLGLTFCKLAVEAHGGRIGLESRLGEGSTFWFTLPAADDRLR